jgi:hypothetical protein
MNFLFDSHFYESRSLTTAGLLKNLSRQYQRAMQKQLWRLDEVQGRSISGFVAASVEISSPRRVLAHANQGRVNRVASSLK